MSSYQNGKTSSASNAQYQTISDASNGGTPSPKKWWARTDFLVCMGFLVIIAGIIGFHAPRSDPTAVIDKAIDGTGNVVMKEDGSLALFDSLSKYIEYQKKTDHHQSSKCISFLIYGCCCVFSFFCISCLDGFPKQ